VPREIAKKLGLAEARGDEILVAVTLNPEYPQETMVHVPIWEMGIEDDQPYVVHDLLTDARYTWRGVRNYVRLDPAYQAGHVFVVERV
jgi:starch synthase (maltosyl-transferring)